jgi:hypothetical protein
MRAPESVSWDRTVKLKRKEMDVRNAVTELVVSLALSLFKDTINVPITFCRGWQAHHEFAEHARPLLNNTEPSPYLPPLHMLAYALQWTRRSCMLVGSALNIHLLGTSYSTCAAPEFNKPFCQLQPCYPGKWYAQCVHVWDAHHRLIRSGDLEATLRVSGGNHIMPGVRGLLLSQHPRHLRVQLWLVLIPMSPTFVAKMLVLHCHPWFFRHVASQRDTGCDHRY